MKHWLPIFTVLISLIFLSCSDSSTGPEPETKEEETPQSYELTINVEGEGEVTEQVVTQKATDYDHGTTVELKANPAHGWSFVEWQGDVSGSDAQVTVTMDKAKTIAAVFDSPFAGGTGTETDPFQIATIEQLQAIDNHEYNSDHFVQINSIDASATAGGSGGIEFSPIMDFEGTYDGQEYTISELTINGTKGNIGLFGWVNIGAKISNVRLENADITGGGYTGSVVGMNNGEVINSSAVGTVHCIDDRCGGLVGNNRGLVKNSFANVEVTSTASWVGGLVGLNRSEIRTSFALGNVKGKESVGGLVGATDDRGPNGFEHRIFRSYAQGDVEGDRAVGGLLGYQYDGSYISYNYASGKVTINTNSSYIVVGGLVGQAENKELVDHSYWDEEKSGQTEAVYGGDSDVTGLTTTQMTGDNAEINMPDFDFVSIWQVVDGGYPTLFWQ